MAENVNTDKSPDTWIWDAVSSIRGAMDAPMYEDSILPLVPSDPEGLVWSVINLLLEQTTAKSLRHQFMPPTKVSGK